MTTPSTRSGTALAPISGGRGSSGAPWRRSAAACALALALSGCEGRFEEAWPDTGERRLSGLSTKVDGAPRATGHWTFWYPDGVTKQAQGWYDAGELPQRDLAPGDSRSAVPTSGRTKKWSFWDESGLILAEGYYLEGARDDLWACWKADGELCCTGPFVEGLEDGFHATWRDGQRVDEHYYEGGRLHGPRVVRDAEGTVVWSGDYRDGEPVDATEPAPPLHRLEVCALAAESGERTTDADHARD